jgi:UV DNA damage endonuclease
MKLGYPCKNWSIGCTGDKTFRLKSYSEKRMIETVSNNLDCLQTMLQFNVNHHLLFFRITSDLIPFASHPICTFDWKAYFSKTFSEIGKFVKKHKIRISMHPDQFIVLNSTKSDVIKRSIDELVYHADVLDAMGLPISDKIQLHIGGVYDDKEKSMNRFISVYDQLDLKIQQRLVIENDDSRYSVSDCFTLSDRTNVPVLFDVFHHKLFNNNESIKDAIIKCTSTWKPSDGIMMLDYSQQEPGRRQGKHAEALDLDQFRIFLSGSTPSDFDIMLEIKDKEKSALNALDIIKHDPRFIGK